MRLLPERPDHDGQGAAGQDTQPNRCADPSGYGPDAMPLHDLLPHPGCNQTRCKNDRRHAAGRGQGGDGMSEFTSIPKQIEEMLGEGTGNASRRKFLKTSGLLVVSVAAAPLVSASIAEAAQRGRGAPAGAAAPGDGPYPDPDYKQLDSWIVIRENN